MKKSILKFMQLIVFIIAILFANKLIESIPNELVRKVINYLIIFSILSFIIFTNIRGVRKKKYTTTVAIIITDIVMIGSFIGRLYIEYLSYNNNNIPVVIQNRNIGATCSIVFNFALLLNISFSNGNSLKGKYSEG